MSDASDGDVIRIGSHTLRLMIKQRGGFLCRLQLPDGTWGGHSFFASDTEIDEIVKVQPKRNPKARKAKGNEDDPLMWRGTQK